MFLGKALKLLGMNICTSLTGAESSCCNSTRNKKQSNTNSSSVSKKMRDGEEGKLASKEKKAREKKVKASCHAAVDGQKYEIGRAHV